MPVPSTPLNRLRQLWSEGRPAFGAIATIPSVQMVQIMARSLDWIIVDLDERHLPFAAATRPGVLDFPDDEMLARWLTAARTALGSAGELLGLPVPVRS